MSVREFDFVVGPETSNLPTVSDPVADSDISNKGFNDANYTNRNALDGKVADITALRATDSTIVSRTIGQLIWVYGLDLFYEWSPTNSDADDGDTVIKPTDISGSGRWLKKDLGGAGAGAGSQITEVIRGEDTTALDFVYLQKRSFLEIIAATNDKIDFNEGGGELTADLSSFAQRYLFHRTADITEMTDNIKSALDTAGALVYTVTFSESTRKFTIAASGSFTLLWNTGSNKATSIATTIGYDDTSDTGSAASHVGDFEIDDQLSEDIFSFKTDGDTGIRSTTVWGVDESGGVKYASSTIKNLSEISGYTNLVQGDLLTASAAIVIQAGVNDKIDFKENAGGELTATLTAANYVYNDGYTDIISEIKTQLESAGADTYTVTYDNDADKFTIAKASGTVQLIPVTGTNTATSAGPSLGYAVDTADAASVTSDTALGLRGKVVDPQSTRVVGNSILAAVGLETNKLYPKRAENETYINVLGNEGAWLDEPIKKLDFANNVLLHDQHENSSGVGVRLIQETTASGTYIFQFKTSHSGSWQTSVSTFTASLPGSVVFTADFFGTNAQRRGSVYAHENGVDMLAFFGRVQTDAANDIRAWGAQSNDGGVTWTLVNSAASFGSAAANDYSIGTCYMREDRACFIEKRNNNSSTVFFSQDTGSGYGTWSNFSGGNVSKYTNASFSFIQFFPGETGVDQFRFCAMGVNNSTGKMSVAYARGDGSGSATSDISLNNVVIYQWAHDDYSNNGNRFACWGGGGGELTFFGAFFGDDFNAGTLTIDQMSDRDFIGDVSSTKYEAFDGNTSNVNETSHSRPSVKGVIVNGRAYFVRGTDGADVATEMFLWFNDDITNDAGWSSLQVGHLDDATTARHQEYQMHFLPATNDLVIMWKKYSDAAFANNATEGQIFTQNVRINSDFSLTKGDILQIDGGEIEAGFQGYSQSSSSDKVISLSWVNDDGGDDDIWDNRFLS